MTNDQTVPRPPGGTTRTGFGWSLVIGIWSFGLAYQAAGLQLEAGQGAGGNDPHLGPEQEGIADGLVYPGGQGVWLGAGVRLDLDAEHRQRARLIHFDAILGHLGEAVQEGLQGAG